MSESNSSSTMFPKSKELKKLMSEWEIETICCYCQRVVVRSWPQYLINHPYPLCGCLESQEVYGKYVAALESAYTEFQKLYRIKGTQTSSEQDKIG